MCTDAKRSEKCRYVTRQGQGSRQSTQDKTGKYANSVGSQIRRQNEAALERSIIETLESWKCHLDACNLIFLHVSSANAKAVYRSGAVQKGDERIRRIPFSTSRPTLAEVKRCLARLAAVEEVPEPQAQPARAEAAAEAGWDASAQPAKAEVCHAAG